MIATATTFLPFAGMVAAVVAGLFLGHWVLIRGKSELGNERLFPRQLIMLGLTLVGIIAVVLVLPVEPSAREKLIGLIGILISGVLAFSSTTVVANLMAGLLLRITKPFRVGDYIRVGEHFGRVAERGLFDTEIQTETRELVALPNTYCITNPVTTTRKSGTIISTTLSLGYDVDRSRIEGILLQAARAAALEEPFVHILELGNFSVTYRISGFLNDPKRLISERSRLNGLVLDALHADGVEIVSPTFMNQRQLEGAEKVIPAQSRRRKESEPERAAEDIAFDKAEQAEERETEKLRLAGEIKALEASLKDLPDDSARDTAKARIEQLRTTLKGLPNGEAGEETGDASA